MTPRRVTSLTVWSSRQIQYLHSANGLNDQKDDSSSSKKTLSSVLTRNIFTVPVFHAFFERLIYRSMSYDEKLHCDYLTTNHEGAAAWRMTPEWELYALVTTTMGTEDKFYERGSDRVMRITDLVRHVQPEFVAQLAVYSREYMQLRTIPLILLVELARCHHGDSLVSRAVSRTVQRADEITELLKCYQRQTGRKRLSGLSVQLRKGLAEAFNRFDEYQFAKYNRTDRRITLRDALLLVHPKPKDERHGKIFRDILNGRLAPPSTWETEFSRTGQQHFGSPGGKKEAFSKVWQQLVANHRIGYMATLRNLHNLLKASVDEPTIRQVCQYLSSPDAVKNSRLLPFRFFSAYCQLKKYIDDRKRPLQDAIDRTTSQADGIQSIVEKSRSGWFPARQRKVVRFSPVHDAVYVHSKSLHESLKDVSYTLHYSRIKYRSVYTEHPSRQMKRRLRRLKNVLNGLRKQESLLKNKQTGIEGKRQINWPMTVRHAEEILQSLEQAVCLSAANIPGFDEDCRVLLASDASGSMFNPISRGSQVLIYHIGLLLSMLVKQKCPQAVTGLFGAIWKVYDMPSADSLWNTMEMIGRRGEVGYSTNGHKVIKWLIEEQRVMDKVMIFTDLQLWNNKWNGDSLAKSWDEYKHMAPNARLYLFDLAGYGHSPVSIERDDVFCITGWSDKVFGILKALEQGEGAIDEIRRIVV